MKRLAILAAVLSAAATSVQAGDKHPFAAKGLYTEACSCHIPCKCEMLGELAAGCEGVGALQLTGGHYNGQDLTGLKAAYAAEPGQWVVLYVQAANPEQRKAGEAFLRAVFEPMGKVESATDARIEITGSQGNYVVSVDDGKVMKYETHVVLGGDKKTAVTHGNIGNPLNKTFKQGRAESATFTGGGHSITLEKGRNAYFNDEMDARGEL